MGGKASRGGGGGPSGGAHIPRRKGSGSGHRTECKGVQPHRIRVKSTAHYEGQLPGTSGLRKKTRVFMQPNYLSNFVQSVLDCIPEREKHGGTLLVSGDGRYYTTEAIYEICAIAAGNGVGQVWIGERGLASTPACSAIIREREGGICFGGFILTASHNPGGIDADFGVKYETANGAPAQQNLMDMAYEQSMKIEKIKYVELPKFSLEHRGVPFAWKGEFQVEIIDAIEDWLAVMRRCFDFSAIKKLISMSSFSFIYDSMHGVSGPYAHKVFVEELGAKPDCLMRQQPLPDFGGKHPDPNLSYADELVKKMKVFVPDEVDEQTPVFGAAGDGDCDRNMILGRGFFVTPSDSVALISLYAEKCIPFFISEKAGQQGLTGLARSMPTSQALDQVAKKLGKPLYETPTGWKYFANLMDANKISICGEESFGTGSVHVREKDGLWAVLAWLSILAYRNGCFSSQQPRMQQPFVSVKQVVEEFWKDLGRNFYCRYDFENKDSTRAQEMMAWLEGLATSCGDNEDLLKQKVSSFVQRELLDVHQFEKIDSFEFHDPVDHQVAKHQGIRLFLVGGSRIVWRLSGTGSTGATIRVYMERYENAEDKINRPTSEALQPIAALALQFCRMKEFIGTDEPTVIT